MWQKLLIKILQALLFPLIDKLWDKIDEYLKSQENKKKEDKEAGDARDKMDRAKDAKEIDDAARDTLDGI